MYELNKYITLRSIDLLNKLKYDQYISKESLERKNVKRASSHFNTYQLITNIKHAIYSRRDIYIERGPQRLHTRLK